MAGHQTTQGPARRDMRSPLKAVRGLGSAHEGVAHWQRERLSGLALVPLTIWFVISALGLLGADQPAVAAWAGRPWNAALLLMRAVGWLAGLMGAVAVLKLAVH